MFRFMIVFLVAATAAAAQTHPSQSAPQQPAPPAVAQKTVAPTEAVVTIAGVCAHSKTTPATGTLCRMVITREQFDKLVDALNPSSQNISPAMRRNLAQTYVQLLAFAGAAEKAGTENDPRFIEVMKLVRLRTLTDVYRQSQEEKLRTPSADEVQAAYNQNTAKFEEVKLSRIFIPAHNPAAQNKDDWEKKAQQTANDVRDRAAKGEDMEKLQKEAYSTLGLAMGPPSTAMGSRRRGTFQPKEEQEIFALNAGGVSTVIQEPAAYIIYKVESKDTLPLDKVKDEISRDIFRQKMTALQAEIMKGVHADYDDAYFGPPPAPPAANSNPSLPRPAGSTSPATSKP